MPELPEVETIRRQLCAAGVEGRIIESVSIHWPRTVEPLSPVAFRKRIAGQTIKKLSRHGKWLIFELGWDDHSPNDPQTARRAVPAKLLVHLRMTGGFSFEPGSHDRAVFQLSGGLNLCFRDPRKFGRFRLEPAGGLRSVETGSSDDGAPPSKLAELGPDALTVTKKQFFQCLEKKNRVLKALLLDQGFVAGVGNIYADEALFEARLHPQRRSASLSSDEISNLWKAVRRVIEAGVRNGGTSLGDGQGNYVDLNGKPGGHREKVKVYGRTGQPCVICGEPLLKTTVAQRTTVFCAQCQR